jgi:hypothetical protein
MPHESQEALLQHTHGEAENIKRVMAIPPQRVERDAGLVTKQCRARAATALFATTACALAP